MRLDRFLTAQSQLSRREAANAVRSGRVSKNGAVIRDPAVQIEPGSDQITLDGKALTYQQYHYILMHKPVGVITAARDPAQKTVLDLLKDEDRRKGLAPVGRLDLDTAGLLLLTDDGQLAHRLISPKHHIIKYYMVWLKDSFDPACIPQFAAGITLREGAGEEKCLPAECVQLSSHTALLAIKEGKYHQVRRMFAAQGNHVEKLLRVQLGGLTLPPDLPPGAYMHISDKEINIICGDSCIFEARAFCISNYSSYWINETE